MVWRQTRDSPPPNVKLCDNKVQQRQRRRRRERGGLIIDRNYDDDGGVRLDIDNEHNKDDDRTLQVIYHGMGGTYNLFLSLYSRRGYESDKIE